jgi:hypothetical protein
MVMRIESKRLLAVVVIAALSAALSGCFWKAPSGWVQGGAVVEVPRARWVNGSERIEIWPNGRVTMNGVHAFTIDGAGRVWRGGGRYVLLQPSGDLTGPNDNSWGFVRIEHAHLPKKPKPWIRVTRAGHVRYFDDDGVEEEEGGGRWYGCPASARTQQVCTLVTYLFRFETKMERARQNREWGRQQARERAREQMRDQVRSMSRSWNGRP